MLMDILFALIAAVAGGFLYTIVGIIPGTDETATMVPTTIILAMVLPFNRLLPISDIAYQAMWLSAYPVAFSKGNVVRSYISCVIFTIIMLFIATSLAPVHTALAVAGGYDLAGAALVSTEDAGTHLLSYLLSVVAGLFH